MDGTRRDTATDLIDRLDALPVTGLHLLIVAACALGFSFDLAEIVFGSILGTIFSAPPLVVPQEMLSLLLAAVYVGAILGAPLGGWLADRHGRRLTMIVTLLVLALTSMAAAFSPGIWALIVARGLSGLALGAYPPLMTAYLADILPPSRRGPLTMAAIAVGYVGPPALIFAVRGLTPVMPLGLEGWRWAFVIGGLGALICAGLFMLVPESPRWLARRGRAGAAAGALGTLLASRAVMAARPTPAKLRRPGPAGEMARQTYLRRLAFLLVIFFLSPWATSGFSLLSGAVLVQKGINVRDSLLYVGISNFGPILGTILGAFFIDRLDRRAALSVAALAMAVFGIAFGATARPEVLMASGLAFNLVTSMFLPVLVIYAAELFTTPRRAVTTSVAWGANRIGSALVPLALLPLLREAGSMPVFVVIGGTLVLFAAVVLGFGPGGMAGRALPEED
ncbi:MFS transporter [bacterium]|nr:MFS transporter [bacterium]